MGHGLPLAPSFDLAKKLEAKANGEETDYRKMLVNMVSDFKRKSSRGRQQSS